MKTTLINCKACGKEIAKKAKICPHCGAKNKKPLYKRAWLWVLVAVVIFASMGNDAETTPNKEVNQITQVVEQTENNNTVVNKTEEKKVEEKKEESVPAEFKTALKKAKTYSDIMHMSKAGIYDQLTSEYGEKFPAEAAQYAIDNLDVDYNENALKKAKTYSDTMHLSKAGIYDQLISEYGEKFTEEEAQYAVDNLEIDYNKNALEKAKTYRDVMSMSNQAIYDQLISQYGEQFTKEEAQYAIDNLDKE